VFDRLQARAALLDIFLHALEECSVEQAFRRHVDYERGVLRFGNDLYSLADYDRVLVVSIGKAAHNMAEALQARTGPVLGGVIAAPTEPAVMLPGFEYFRGGHPVPDGGSVRAAEAVLRALRSVTARSLAIFLISGGGSAVIEKPIRDIPLADLTAAYEALVHSGAPITQINTLRKHLSAIKGGRLAQAAAPARQVSGLLVDVPEGSLDALASGPTMPDPTTVDDCYAIAAQYDLVRRFPPSVREVFGQRALEETPKADDPAFVRSRWWVLLSGATAVDAAQARACAHGLAVDIDNSCDDWDYAAAADYLLGKLRKLRQTRREGRVCLISGGEVTVKISHGGVGGRNQQFALYCATRIAGEKIAVLSAGTDGIDGNSPAAGAMADGSSLERARAAGLGPEQALRHFDAYPLFIMLGDAIVTRATGTNVRDLRLLVAW
jgi:hydroxypyruvate reductase